jgi:hypothetical protein
MPLRAPVKDETSKAHASGGHRDARLSLAGISSGLARRSKPSEQPLDMSHGWELAGKGSKYRVEQGR